MLITDVKPHTNNKQSNKNLSFNLMLHVGSHLLIRDKLYADTLIIYLHMRRTYLLYSTSYTDQGYFRVSVN